MSTEDTAIVEVKSDYRLGVIQAKNSHDIVVQATHIAKELAGIVGDRKLYRDISGKRFVFVEGWSTMGAMLGILPREKSVQRMEDGSYEATVELIRVSDGMVIGGASALCGMDESTWARRNDYARRSMAITRATSKAFRLGFSWIMVLAGYEATPAEEMPVDAEFHDAPPPRRPAEQILDELGFDPKPAPVKAGRPLSPEKLADFLNKKAVGYAGKTANDKQFGLFAGMMDNLVAGDKDKVETICEYLFGVTSRKEVPGEMVLAALDWLKPTKDSGGAYSPDPMAVTEAEAVWTEALKDEGQQELL